MTIITTEKNKKNKSKSIRLRNLKFEDYLDLKEVMIKAYKDMPEAYWKEHHIEKLLSLFPKGQLCVTVNGKVVATALSLIVDYKKFGDSHTYKQITGDYTFTTHDPNGDVLYGIDVFVHPDYRGMRLGKRLYEARKKLCEKLNLRSIIMGGRIPNYNQFSEKLDPKGYIEKVKIKEIYDPVLSFQIANEFHVKKILNNYLQGDIGSKEYATLLEWNNIYHGKDDQFSNKSVIRLGLVQWQMRLFKETKNLIEQIEFFVDAVSSYNTDFILFPEFFEAPLMAKYNDLGEAQAIRKLAGHTEELRKTFSDFAINYNVNIITGSMPILENGQLYNITYLCRRDGSYESYKKIHITPSEVNAWGMKGGEDLGIFDTDCGKIGILICYDVEFPELCRLYAEQGVQILFVPFLTDTQNGFNRVKRCAQARAIENECYVAIAGSVGNLPKVNNMDIQYAQSAVFTPSDFAFPTNSIRSEATPNTEMTLISDVDLDLLKELHTHGSVKNLKDRRKDLYEIKWKGTKKKE